MFQKKFALNGFLIFFSLLIFFNLLIPYYYIEAYKISKPLIMASLMGYYVASVHRQSYLLLLAFLCALLGDIFLLFEGDIFFIAGLSSFIVMHALYIRMIGLLNVQPKSAVIKKSVSIFSLIFIFWGMFHHSFGAFKWSVLFYACVLGLGLLMAWTRSGRSLAHKYLLIGYVLFFVSDLSLAIDKFIVPHPIWHVPIMLTYMVCQFLIVEAFIRFTKEHVQPSNE